ncbi:MAG TPA: ABC transporter substrate-binding protein [Gaiellaceae bacterium]|nr:ABC transporter substrate-binding protein [Gaiellaceae bacterium]
MKRFMLVLGLTAAVALLAVIPGALGRTQATPGVTSTNIKIGTTLPLSGVAAIYSRIGVGMRAWFSYVNARKSSVDHKRGVYGRQITLNIYDDGYQEANTVQQTRRAVEQDGVFAMLGGLGTENQLAVRDYLNQKKVPQLYVSTGLAGFADLKNYPWTIGWQPDYAQEGILLGKYVKANIPNAKIGVLFQNDDYGKQELEGFQNVVGKNAIVASRGYPRGGGSAAVTPLIPQLKASGADTLFIIATPQESYTSLAVAYKIGWKPNKIVNSVGATDTFMAVAKQIAGSPDAVEGVVTAQYLKDPVNPKYANDPQIKLYEKVMDKYAPSFPNPRDDGLFIYGMAKADTFVQALYRAGKNPTRQSLMNAVSHLTIKKDGWLIPGAKLITTPKSAFPLRYQTLSRYTNGHFTEFGNLVRTR